MNGRGIADKPVYTQTFYNSNNAKMTPPSNVKLTDPKHDQPSTSTQTNREQPNFKLGKNIESYFQNKYSQTPGTDGLKREYPISNGRSGGSAAVIEGAAQAAGGVGSGMQSSWNIGQNANITNNWFNNISGVNGIYNGMHDRASLQASAEQRAIDRSNNWANTGKAVAGPMGQLFGGIGGWLMKNNYTQTEMDKTNFKTQHTTDGKMIDPKQSALSTASNKNNESRDPAVHARNVAYGPDSVSLRGSDTDSIASNDTLSTNVSGSTSLSITPRPSVISRTSDNNQPSTSQAGLDNHLTLDNDSINIPGLGITSDTHPLLATSSA